jgi:hypothetical protein
VPGHPHGERVRVVDESLHGAGNGTPEHPRPGRGDQQRPAEGDHTKGAAAGGRQQQAGRQRGDANEQRRAEEPEAEAHSPLVREDAVGAGVLLV